MVGEFEGVNPILSDFEITVEKMVYGGDGLGRLDGRAVLTPFVLPGERAQVRPLAEKPGLLRARLLEVLAPAAQRVIAPCPYYGRCGGCHYQHAGYEAQLDLKRAILDDQLRRIAKIPDPGDIEIVSGEPWGYRNRVQLHVNGRELGYRAAQSHRLVSIDTCHISSPAILNAIRALRAMARDPRWPAFLRSVELFTNETEMQLTVLESERPVARRFFDWCAAEIPGLVSGALDYPAAGHNWRVSPGSFFQVNRFLMDRLVETAIGDASGATALDLYAGVGLFTAALARRFAAVTAVESGHRAAADLQFNMERAGLSVRVEKAGVEDWIEQLAARPDFALFDPPRAGIGKRVAARIVALRIPSVAIVSCDPATLARDVAALLAGGYHLRSLALVDLFPQTFHLETVVRLELR